MARLTPELWEKARAEYETRGVSLGEIAKQFDVNVSSVSRKASREGWKQGQMQGLVDKKVACLKGLSEVRTQMQDLSPCFRHTIDSVVQERLQADGALATLDVTIAKKAAEMAKTAKTPEELETLSRARKNLAPPTPKETNVATVNVTQQQAQNIPTPRDTLAQLVRDASENDG